MIQNIINHAEIFFVNIVPNAISKVFSLRFAELNSLTPLMLGVLLQIALIVLLILLVRGLKKTKFSTLFEYIVEEVYKFFEEILEVSGKPYIKTYVVTLFFIILLSNLSSWILDWIRIIFVDVERLSSIITIPTTSFEFNIGLATVAVLLMLFIQFKHLGSIKMFFEYVPLFGKGIIDIPRGNMPKIFFWPLWFLVKLFDIGISLFVGLLDIIGVFAKVISLSARLYGNMVSGGILLTMLVIGVGSAFKGLLGINLPIIGPIILYAQGLLVSVIQAFVFPLLVAIFIKLVVNEEDAPVG